MSSTRRGARNESRDQQELAGLSTTMMRHSRRIKRALDAEDDSVRPKLSVVPGLEADDPSEIAPSEIRKINAYIKAHRRRDLLFSPGMFGDSAWEMLLDLFIAKGETRQVTMDSVCLAVGVPASTAWRKFAALEEDGLVARYPDPDDRRKTMVEVTPVGVHRIRLWLSQLEDCTSMAG
ncbi:MAG: winged helix DNA-binding protein [Parasphingopyxis sp.]|nr:winged helix DNA-binding protein [Sphingomonadales bacterium]